MFPYGTIGFDEYVHRKGMKVSELKFYQAMIQDRYDVNDDLNEFIRNTKLETCNIPLTHFGRLFQEYLLDQWVKIECYRLKYIQSNQSKLRSELYVNLKDFLNRTKKSKDTNVGHQANVILPNTFTGSPRWYDAEYHDVMAIARILGKASFSITITCNPNWPEIKNSLNKNRELITDEVLGKAVEEGKEIYGYEFEGKWLECGNKLAYLKSNFYLSLKHPQFGKELKKFLK